MRCLPQTGGLTRCSTGRAPVGFASFRAPVSSNVGRQKNLRRETWSAEIHATRSANTRCASAMKSDLGAREASASRTALREPLRLGSWPPRLQASSGLRWRRAARWPILSFADRPLLCGFHSAGSGAPPRLNQRTRFAIGRAARRKTSAGQCKSPGTTNFTSPRLCATVTLPPNPLLNRTRYSRLRLLAPAGYQQR